MPASYKANSFNIHAFWHNAGQSAAELLRAATISFSEKLNYIRACKCHIRSPNLYKSVHRQMLFGSCFVERCLKPGLTYSPYRKGIPLGQA
jgi:hypothetical protein